VTEKRFLKKRDFFLILCAIAAAFLLSFTYLLFKQIPEFTILNHSPVIKAGVIFPLTLAFLLILIGLWLGYSSFFSRLCKLDRGSFAFQDFLTYIPLLFLVLLPLLLTRYLDSGDLLERASILSGSVLLAVFYLKATVLYRHRTRNKFDPPRLRGKISSLSPRKKLALLFLAALILYNAGSVLLTSSGQTFAGDEPHYLLISHSLLEDGDIDLSNNYENRDYQDIMLAQVRIDPHLAPGTKSRYSFHSPGTSFLLLPFYALASLFKGKLLVFFIRLGMSVFGALLGIQVFLFTNQEWKNEKLALGIWFLYSFSSPVFFYSLHVYPEIFIALFSLTAFRLLRFSSSLSRTRLLFLGFLISCFIWFHAIKYIFIMVPLFIYAVWTLFKKHKVGWNLLYFFIFPSILTSFYFLFQYTFYGSLSLASISWRGAMTPQESLAYFKSIATGIPFRYRWETLAGYFFDQKDGLLLYAPFYFFAFLGCVEIARRNVRFLLLLLFLTVPYVLNSALLTQRSGYAPQARPLVAVSWGLIILVGYFLRYNSKKIFKILFNGCVFIGFCFVFLLLKNPLALYQLTTAGTTERFGHLFLLLSNLRFSLYNYLPSYIKTENAGWTPNLAWAAGVLLFVSLYIASKNHSFRMKISHHLGIVSFGILLIFFWLALNPRTVLLYPENTPYPSGQKITFYSLGRVAQMQEPGEFQLPRANRAYIFHFTSWQKLKGLRLSFGSPDGVFDVEIELFDQVLYKGQASPEIATLELAAPHSYRFKNTNLYRVTIRLQRKSGVIAFAKPFRFSILPII
jgi:hypothetical protein